MQEAGASAPIGFNPDMLDERISGLGSSAFDLLSRKIVELPPDPSGGGQDARRFSIRQGQRIEKSR